MLGNGQYALSGPLSSLFSSCLLVLRALVLCWSGARIEVD